MFSLTVSALNTQVMHLGAFRSSKSSPGHSATWRYLALPGATWHWRAHWRKCRIPCNPPLSPLIVRTLAVWLSEAVCLLGSRRVKPRTPIQLNQWTSKTKICVARGSAKGPNAASPSKEATSRCTVTRTRCPVAPKPVASKGESGRFGRSKSRLNFKPF